MVVQTKPLVEITETAIRLLVRKMGPADTLRFVNQFTLGQGNYTEERSELFADMTLDDILDQIKRDRQAGPQSESRSQD
jgi:hypothetical protein